MAGVELRRREETEDRGAIGVDGCGPWGGVSPSPLGLCPSPGHFLNFVSGNGVI